MIESRDLQNRAVFGPDEDSPRLSIADLARYWNVHPNTVYRDVRKGALPAFRVGAGGQFRIRPSDARRYGRPVE